MKKIETITFEEFIDTYFHDLSQNEIGKAMKLTPAGVSKLKKGSGDVSPSSETWRKAKEYVLNHCGKVLIPVNKDKAVLEIAIERIKELETALAKSEEENAKLTDAYIELTRQVRIMSNIKDTAKQTISKKKLHQKTREEVLKAYV